MLIPAQNAMVISSMAMIPPQSTKPLSPWSPKAVVIVATSIAAEHEHVAVREVDQLEDSVDERVAERDQAVYRTVRDADQEGGCRTRTASLTRLTSSQTKMSATKITPTMDVGFGR